MGDIKKNKPKVIAFKDYFVIKPPNGLADRATQTSEEDNPVARAEAALAGLAPEFDDWMKLECERLSQARHALRAQITKDGLSDLFHAAHDIKGEAATLGYPLAGQAAASLCRLIIDAKNPTLIPLLLIDQHVDAVRAIIREASDASARDIGEALVGELEALTDAFLANEETLAFGRLRLVSSPPLSPEGEVA